MWRLGVALTVAAVLLQTAGYFVNVFLLDSRIEQLEVGNLPDGTESQVFTWMSASPAYAAGFAALIIALASERHFRLFGALAVALFYYSFDDHAQVHEHVGRVLGGWGVPQDIANVSDFVLLAPIAVATFFLIYRAAQRVPQPAARGLNIALWMLVASVFLDEGVRIPTKHLAKQGVNTPEYIRNAAEEGLELAALMLLATALACALCYTLDGIGRTRRGGETTEEPPGGIGGAAGDTDEPSR
jgi:hypothetical protein